ncbi:hypothetical protein MTBUT4_60090 [Magnetospirillum sp. UT-4]|nr:hypothetical protein MTBUT4_60090 [Magnetospirillum sp. UT-4]
MRGGRTGRLMTRAAGPQRGGGPAAAKGPSIPVSKHRIMAGIWGARRHSGRGAPPVRIATLDST